jgi:hypothetical protein
MFLAIPASSAPVERVFSGAGFVFTQRRQALLATGLESLVFVRENAPGVPEFEKAYAAAVKKAKEKPHMLQN